MRVTIHPSRAQGSVAAPPSKSMAHRLLVCAGLTSGNYNPSLLFGLEDSQDVLATIDCLNVLGASISRQNDCTVVYGIDASAVRENDVLPCRECGSTLRFFVPLCLLLDKPLTLTGSETLLHRPMSVYHNICADQGLLFAHDSAGIHVQGPLHAGTFTVPGNISSQFISGLLFALPLLADNSTIVLTEPVESRSYINMTIKALELFGVSVSWQNSTTLEIPGKQHYCSASLRVEGDYSNAAFLEALNYVRNQTDSNTAGEAAVTVTGLQENSLQGDRVYQELFPSLKTTTPTISLSDCPDLGPVLMAVAAANKGAVFTNCERLALKESNRGQAMAQELKKFGICVSSSEDQSVITIHEGTLHTPAEPLNAHNDHRIVMALATLACVTGGTIMGAEAVTKSFPSYFERLQQLGITLYREDEHEMD